MMKRILEIIKIAILKCSVAIRKQQFIASSLLWGVVALFLATVIIGGRSLSNTEETSVETNMETKKVEAKNAETKTSTASKTSTAQKSSAAPKTATVSKRPTTPKTTTKAASKATPKTTSKTTTSSTSNKSSSSATRASSSSKRRAVHQGLKNSMSDFDQCKIFDKDIEAFLRRWELTGASFALMRNDSLLYAKGYGFANKERGEKMEVGHIMRMASASKLITATAIMKLIEQKRLTLNSKVFGEDGILSEAPFNKLADSKMKLITISHLLRHTGGFKTPIEDPAFANYSVAKALERKLPLTLDDMVRYSTMFKLQSMPGDKYDYSNLGYQILTKVVEVASGEGYESFVKRNILEPAGCFDMHIGENYSSRKASNEVNYYEVKEATLFDAFDGSGKKVLKSNGGNNVNLLSGAGGWVASPAELLRFVASINGSGTKLDILSKKSVETMTKSGNERPIGWAMIRGKEWLRSGSMAGSCTLIKHESNGYTWVFITNSSAWIGYKLTNYISPYISKSIAKVKEWPKQDLFE